MAKLVAVPVSRAEEEEYGVIDCNDPKLLKLYFLRCAVRYAFSWKGQSQLVLVVGIFIHAETNKLWEERSLKQGKSKC